MSDGNNSFHFLQILLPVFRQPEPFTAKMSRAHNDCNVLAFGARVVGGELAKMIVDTWINTEFEGGRHQRRVDLLMEIEEKN